MVGVVGACGHLACPAVCLVEKCCVAGGVMQLEEPKDDTCGARVEGVWPSREGVDGARLIRVVLPAKTIPRLVRGLSDPIGGCTGDVKEGVGGDVGEEAHAFVLSTVGHGSSGSRSVGSWP